MTNAVSKEVAIAVDEPLLGQSTDCLNWLVELIKEKLAIAEDSGKMFQLLTILPCDISISKVAEDFKVSEYTTRQACEFKLQKGMLSMPEQKQRVGISQETKQIVLAFYEGEEISCLLPVKKDCVSIWLPDKTKMKKQKQLPLSSISAIYAQFKKENPDWKIGFSTFALLRPKCCIPVGAVVTCNACVCSYHQNVKFKLVVINLSHNDRQIIFSCKTRNHPQTIHKRPGWFPKIVGNAGNDRKFHKSHEIMNQTKIH